MSCADEIMRVPTDPTRRKVNMLPTNHGDAVVPTTGSPLIGGIAKR